MRKMVERIASAFALIRAAWIMLCASLAASSLLSIGTHRFTARERRGASIPAV
jgi:hypothetical protein